MKMLSQRKSLTDAFSVVGSYPRKVRSKALIRALREVPVSIPKRYGNHQKLMVRSGFDLGAFRSRADFLRKKYNMPCGMLSPFYRAVLGYLPRKTYKGKFIAYYKLFLAEFAKKADTVRLHIRARIRKSKLALPGWSNPYRPNRSELDKLSSLIGNDLLTPDRIPDIPKIGIPWETPKSQLSKTDKNRLKVRNDYSRNLAKFLAKDSVSAAHPVLDRILKPELYRVPKQKVCVLCKDTKISPFGGECPSCRTEYRIKIRCNRCNATGKSDIGFDCLLCDGTGQIDDLPDL
jgi:hypothetical protein